MTKTIRTAAATAGLLAALALPFTSLAATTTSAPVQHYQLQTRLSDRYSAGEYDGQLTLTVYPDGIVQGTYRPSSGGFRTVTGGLDGKNTWLEIGMQRPLHLTGTFTNGQLVTAANIPGPDAFTFESVDTVKSREKP